MIITTQHLANPKPQRGIDYCGQPMKDGHDYWGKPIIDTDQDAVSRGVEPSTARPDDAGGSRQPTPRYATKAYWTPEKRAEISAKVRAAWARRKAATDNQYVGPPS